MKTSIKKVLTQVLALLLVCASLACACAAQTQSVPRMVRFSGTFTGAQQQSTVLPATFAIYADAQGGVALWSETQNVATDATGRYSVLLGATSGDGIPAGIFADNEARWLGVQAIADSQPEQPRVLLVSVPYALKAQDADTLGGRSLADFVLQSTLDRRLSDLNSAPLDASKTSKLSATSKATAAASAIGSQSAGAIYTDPTALNNYKWLELIPDQATSATFSGTLYNFPQPGDSTHDNWVMRLGYNIVGGGGRENFSEPGMALEWESHYSPYAGQTVQEFHLAHVGANGVVQRPITFYRPTIGPDSLGLNNSVLQLGDAAANVKAFFGLGGRFDWYMSPSAPDNERIYFLRTNRNTATYNSGSGATTAISFQKLDENDYWQIGAAFTISHATGNIGMGSIPVSDVRMRVSPNSTIDGLDMYANSAPPHFFLRATINGSDQFKVDGTGNTTIAGNTTVSGAVTSALGFLGNLTGTASLATAFAADPADCLTARFATAIAANGDLTCAAIQSSDLPSLSASYVDLTTAQTIAGAKTFADTIIGDISGNAGTVTNGVYTTSTYADPNWITSVAGAKITGTVNAAAIALALGANPTDCVTGFAVSIDAQGNLTCATIQAGDLPSLSNTYVDLTTAQTIAGSKTFTAPLTTAQTSSLQQTVAFSATPTFDAGAGNNFKLTLTGDVTSSLLTNAVAGQTLVFLLCQDATGGRNFAWPPNFRGTKIIGATASKCSAQQYYFDGTDAFALTPGVVNQ